MSETDNSISEVARKMRFNEIMKEEVLPGKKAENIIHYFEENGETMEADDKNLIANVAYKYDAGFAEEIMAGVDMQHMSITDIKGVVLQNAKNKIALLPDEIMGYTELHNYGYQGYDMYPLSAEKALELYFHDIPVYLLYPDNTEQLMEDEAYVKISGDIGKLNADTMYGVEKEVWDKHREMVNDINLMELGRDYLKISISSKRVVSSFTSKKSGEPIEYCKLLAPEGMTYIRKKEQIHDDTYNEGKKYFILPKGQEITLEYKTDKITGYTQDGKPIHETERITVTAEKLKEMYDAEKRHSLERNTKNDKPDESNEKTNPFIEDISGEEKTVNSKKHVR